MISNSSFRAEPVTGTLKGYDQLLNLVMDDLEEVIRGQCPSSFASLSIANASCAPSDPESGLPLSPPQTRSLGLAVLRGTSLVVLSPVDGYVASRSPASSNGKQLADRLSIAKQVRGDCESFCIGRIDSSKKFKRTCNV